MALPTGPTVTVEDDPALRAELLRRLAAGPAPRSVWVTDLVDPRPAFWRATAPVRPAPEREARMAEGREAHAEIAARLGLPAHREVRIRRAGIVGQVDLWEDRPTEVKTTQSLPAGPSLKESRPQYVEQVAMYCALAEAREGRLVLLETSGGTVAAGAVYDVPVPRPDRALAVMEGRARLLRAARDGGRPDGLPRCAWFGRGCEFQEAGVCDCTGMEPPLGPELLVEVGEPEVNPGERDRVLGRLALPPEGPKPVALRFRDLLFPRRAFYERTRPPPGGARGEGPAPLPRGDLWGAISDLLESGERPEVEFLPARGDIPAQRVACFQGRPYLIKTSRAWRPLAGSEIGRTRPHYLTELELRCSAVGRAEALLLVGYERAESWEDRLAVFRVRFPEGAGPSALAAAREAALAGALATGDPTGLPACPAWMYEDCPYRSECGCGPGPGRAQR